VIDHDKGFPAVNGAVDRASASPTPIPATAALAQLAWCLTNQHATGTASSPVIPDQCCAAATSRGPTGPIPHRWCSSATAWRAVRVDPTIALRAD
jgi:hypothetical protein